MFIYFNTILKYWNQDIFVRTINQVFNSTTYIEIGYIYIYIYIYVCVCVCVYVCAHREYYLGWNI
jgi:hypothetical protein